MERYEPNSHKFKERKPIIDVTPEKKVEKIISGSVKTKKPGTLKKLTDVFIAEDVGKVKSYIWNDVLVPLVKKAIDDTVHSILYGEKEYPKKNNNASNVSYRSYYDKPDTRRDYNSQGKQTAYSCDDVIIETRGEAEEVLDRMEELIDIYGLISVADFYDLVGVSGNYTDNKYGWTDLRSATAVQMKDGYIIKLPKAKPLN